MTGVTLISGENDLEELGISVVCEKKLGKVKLLACGKSSSNVHTTAIERGRPTSCKKEEGFHFFGCVDLREPSVPAGDAHKKKTKKRKAKTPNKKKKKKQKNPLTRTKQLGRRTA